MGRVVPVRVHNAARDGVPDTGRGVSGLLSI
jgi:hypothetical protein